jgi:light-regulated signal transduction histidine kinase (bacteriophytochrome)
VPLLGRQDRVGLMTVARKTTAAFDPEEISLLRALGREIGVMVELARMVRQLREANERIRRANQALDDFTYVVSHDLKEPLRSVESLSGLLRDEFCSHDDPEARRILQMVIDSTQRLRQQIDDLLVLSRVGRRAGPALSLNMNALVKRVRGNLSALIAETGAEVIVEGTLPQAEADLTGVEMVMANLLSNAFKFNESKPPKAWISGKPGGEPAAGEHSLVMFCVRDNGIGIPPEHHADIFAVFRRLHPRERYEGTGAGLAIAARIVEHHGGRIWVESEPGKGSSFYFTLPAVLA